MTPCEICAGASGSTSLFGLLEEGEVIGVAVVCANCARAGVAVSSCSCCLERNSENEPESLKRACGKALVKQMHAAMSLREISRIEIPTNFLGPINDGLRLSYGSKLYSVIESLVLNPESLNAIKVTNENCSKIRLSVLAFIIAQKGYSFGKICLSWNRLDETDAKALVKLLKLTEELDISWNRIGTAGSMQLSSALVQNINLVDLNLSANKIGPRGAEAIAAAITKNETLQNLNLSFNGIQVRGAEALSRMLPLNRSLVSLNLRNNEIGPAGAVALAKGLGKSNRANFDLTLVDNSIGEEGATALAGFFRGKISLLKKCVM